MTEPERLSAFRGQVGGGCVSVSEQRSPCSTPAKEYRMSELAAPVRPDTRDMVAVHAVFRQALATAPRIVGGASRTDRQHAANVASFYANLLAFLHVHHEGEDALLWPKLLERSPAE